MFRWIAFDPASAAAIVAASQTAPELHHRGDALSAALASDGPAVVLTPSSVAGRTLIAEIRRSASSDSLRPIAYEVTGFLGLVDQPIYEEEPEPPKKWWQKLLG